MALTGWQSSGFRGSNTGRPEGGSGFRGSNLGVSGSNLNPFYGTISPTAYFGAMNPFASQQFGNARADARADYRNALAGLGHQRQDIRTELSRLGPDRQHALAMLGIDSDRIGLDRQRLGLSREDIGLSREGLGIDESDARREARMARIGTESEYTGRGAWFAPMLGVKREDIAKGLESDLGRIDLSRRGLDIDERGLGIDEQGLGLDERAVGLQRQATERDFSRQRQDLQRAAQRFGLDERQLQERLNRALRDIGLEEKMQVGDLFGHTDPQARAQAEALLEWAMGGQQGPPPMGG